MQKKPVGRPVYRQKCYSTELLTCAVPSDLTKNDNDDDEEEEEEDEKEEEEEEEEEDEEEDDDER